MMKLLMSKEIAFMQNEEAFLSNKVLLHQSVTQLIPLAIRIVNKHATVGDRARDYRRLPQRIIGNNSLTSISNLEDK